MPRAFTLIELLIVVAIIAILAAIAVPNFLEAQTRSKVSRAKADMRTLAVAIDSYRVDQSAYPSGESNGTQKWLWRVTTPIAYIARCDIYDPFTGPTADPAALATLNAYPYYRYYIFNEQGYLNSASASGAILGVYSPPGELKAKFYTLFCHGPDGIRSQTADGKTFLQEDILLNPVRFSELIYDPTNGTTSNGDIFRVGGEPIGRAAGAMG